MRNLITVFTLLASLSCAHVRPDRQGLKPPTWGAFAVQCQETRQVYCAIDKEFTMQQCMDTVIPAINDINLAAGRPLYHFAGFQTYDQDTVHLLVNTGIYVVFGGDLRKGILGETRIQFDPTVSQCISAVFTVLDDSVWAHEEELHGFARGVVLHEMLHALGAQHADVSAQYDTNMMPSASMERWKPYLTPSDVLALRGIYTR